MQLDNERSCCAAGRSRRRPRRARCGGRFVGLGTHAQRTGCRRLPCIAAPAAVALFLAAVAEHSRRRRMACRACWDRPVSWCATTAQVAQPARRSRRGIPARNDAQTLAGSAPSADPVSPAVRRAVAAREVRSSLALARSGCRRQRTGVIHKLVRLAGLSSTCQGRRVRGAEQQMISLRSDYALRQAGSRSGACRCSRPATPAEVSRCRRTFVLPLAGVAVYDGERSASIRCAEGVPSWARSNFRGLIDGAGIGLGTMPSSISDFVLLSAASSRLCPRRYATWRCCMSIYRADGAGLAAFLRGGGLLLGHAWASTCGSLSAVVGQILQGLRFLAIGGAVGTVRHLIHARVDMSLRRGRTVLAGFHLR